jgi:hypothetical protein
MVFMFIVPVKGLFDCDTRGNKKLPILNRESGDSVLLEFHSTYPTF